MIGLSAADALDLGVKRAPRRNWFEGPYGFVLKNRRALPFVKRTGGLGPRNAAKQLLTRIGLEE
jgi:hypothetical protein